MITDKRIKYLVFLPQTIKKLWVVVAAEVEEELHEDVRITATVVLADVVS
jgi:hypothetical protein